MKKIISILSIAFGVTLFLASCGSNVTMEQITAHLDKEFDKEATDVYVYGMDMQYGSFSGVKEEDFVSGRIYLMSDKEGMHYTEYAEFKSKSAAKEYEETMEESERYSEIENLGKIVICTDETMWEILKPLIEG